MALTVLPRGATCSRFRRHPGCISEEVVGVRADMGMVFRVSAKLGKKIRLGYEQSLPSAANPLLDWSADLFTADRTKYIIVSNTASLYSVVMCGRGVTDESRFLQDSISQMREMLEADGFATAFRQVIGPSSGRIALAKRQNRSVIGSMNDLIFQARLRLVHDEISPYETSLFLNRTLMSYIDYRRPREAFQRMVDGHQLT